MTSVCDGVRGVHALDEQDDDFRAKFGSLAPARASPGGVTRSSAASTSIQRMNLLWLHGVCGGDHHGPTRYEDAIRTMASAGKVSSPALFGADDGSEEVKPVVWHLLWAGDLCADMECTRRGRPHTEVTLGSGVRHD